MNAASNTKWAAVGQSARILSQLANMFVLARILPPSDYGLMAMAGVATNLALLLRDMGTAAAVIQKNELDHGTINAVFWLNVVMGVIIASVMAIFSPLIAGAFKTPALIGVLCSLSITYPLSSSSAVHQALLERHSQFRRLAMIDVASAIIALIAAIIAALNGLGVYSLVIQAITNAGMVTLLLWVTSTWRPTGNAQMSRLKELFGFSSNMAGYQLVSYLFRNADSMVIGRLLGSTPLGFYSMAYKIMLMPVQNITWVSLRAIFPIMSRQQNNIPEMAKLYLSAIRTISFLVAPIMTGLFAMRHDFIAFALGDKWSMIASLLAIMTPIGYLQAVSGATGPVFMAQGKTSLLLKIGIFGALIHIIFFITGSHWGIEGVATAYFCASISVTVPTIFLAQKALDLSQWDTLQNAMPSVIAAIIAATIVMLVNKNISFSNYLIMNLFIQSMVGLVTYSSILLIFARPYFINILKR